MNGGVAAAAAHIRAGRLVAFPTETVYGLGADATDDGAVARVFEAKGRPHFNPLIVHVASLGQARRLGGFDERALALAHRFWPGPLTLVVPRTAACPVSWLASAGLETLALRWPDHPMAEALIRAAERPLVGPSANRSGHLSPTRPGHVTADLGDRVAAVLDGGPCRVGIESTVIGLVPGRALMLRVGALGISEIGAVVGPVAEPEPDAGEGEARPSPGMLLRHYAPRAPLRLGAAGPRPGEAMLGFGAVPGDANLSPAGDPTEAAANLFAMMRALDGGEGIAVAPIPDHGIGRAINDRLRRAAASDADGR